MSSNTLNYDELQKKKEKSKDLTQLQKYILTNNNMNKKLNQSPTKTKVPSKLPISVPKKSQIIKQEESKPDPIKLTDKQDKNTNSSSLSSLSSSSSEDEDLIRLNEMLERFRSSKPVSHQLHKNDYDWHSSKKHDLNKKSQNNNNNSDKEADIVDLKNRLNILRQKLFNPNISTECKDRSDDDSCNENRIEHSKLDQRPPQIPKIKLKEPILVDTIDNKFSSSNKSKKDYNNIINIDSIDLKANQLIEKSESSLTEKLISSEGLSSSRSTSSTFSTMSSNFQETNPYKPEFLKYLENKSKLGYLSENGEALKPEEDILYQWRLRRKLEEAKKLNILNDQNFKTNNNSNQDKPIVNNIPIEKQSMQTQTSNLCDSSVQTSLEIINLRNEEKKSSLNHETPTRDVCIQDDIKKSNTTNKKLSQSNEKIKKPNYLSSSPVRTTNSRYSIESNQSESLNPLYSNSLKSLNNISSADLTRVSSITENTPITQVCLPKQSSSPICFNQKTIIKKPPSTSNLILSSVVSSTLTAASDDNVDTKTNQLNVKSIDLDQTVVIKSNKMSGYETSNHHNNDNVYTQSEDEYDYIQKEMIESDEILRILLKKTYYYKLKLKQIDDLLTK